MSKKIIEIYEEYKIMPNLQEHMLRVAAVASMICDNFDGPIAKDEIVLTCLLHDMGNIIKSNLEFFPDFIKKDELDYWYKVKSEYIEKYGNNEHKATLQIMQELKVSPRVIFLIDQIKFSLICGHRDSKDFGIKIVHYADGRVDPHGIVSYEERMEEGRKRYANNTSSFGSVSAEERERLVACGKEIEKQIFDKCKIKPEDINNETVASIISKLRDFVVK